VILGEPQVASGVEVPVGLADTEPCDGGDQVHSIDEVVGRDSDERH